MVMERRENEPFPEMPERVSIDRVTSYEVYDSNDQDIGSTSAIWMDVREQPAFIGVKTSRLFGKTHVIPAWGAEVNHRAHRVRVPCPKDVIDDAPSFSPDEELDEEREHKIMDYFKAKGACLPKEEAPPKTEAAAPTAETARGGEETVIPLHEEELKVGKRTVEAGGLRLHKIVRSETVQQPVELRREEIEVERAPAAGERRPSEKAFEEEDIYIPLRREEPVVEKETRVREELRARKTGETERKTVSGEVRKEDIEEERRKAD